MVAAAEVRSSVKPERRPAEADVDILVVEDSPTQAEKLRFILEEAGYGVRVVGNGVEALAALEQHRPTVVITDIVMPEMDGFELCDAIRSRARLEDLPVIALTALSDPKDVLRGLECGADHFVTKPYDEEYLLHSVARLVASCRMPRADRGRLSLELFLGERKYLINSERLQVLNLLLATYDVVIGKNRELIAAAEGRARALAQEVTRRKQAEDTLKQHARELSRSNTQLAQARQKAEDASLAKSELLSAVSHEMRTPLTSMRNALSNMLAGVGGELDETLTAYLGMLDDDCSRLCDLVNSFLDAARFVTGGITLEQQSMDVGQAARRMVEACRTRAEKKRIAVSVEIPTSVPAARGHNRAGLHESARQRDQVHP